MSCSGVDLGLRQRFAVRNIPASLRVIVANIFDEKAWKVVASNTLQIDERRRYSISLTADF